MKPNKKKSVFSVNILIKMSSCLLVFPSHEFFASRKRSCSKELPARWPKARPPLSVSLSEAVRPPPEPVMLIEPHIPGILRTCYPPPSPSSWYTTLLISRLSARLLEGDTVSDWTLICPMVDIIPILCLSSCFSRSSLPSFIAPREQLV